MTGRYWSRVCAIQSRQAAKGLAEYGQALEENPAAAVERVQHLEEELIDGLMYCEWLKEQLAHGEDDGK